MENWRNPSTSSDRETSACKFKSSSSSNAYKVPSRSISNNPRFRSYANTNAQNSNHYNWRVSSKMDEERNLDRTRERSTSFHSSDYLIEINSKNSNIIILELIEKLDDFAQFLNSNLEPDWIVLTIAILSKVCSSCFRCNKLAILKIATEASFLQALANYIKNVKYEESTKPDKNKSFWNNAEEFFNNLLFVCDFISEIMSNEVCEIIVKLVEDIHQTMTYLEKRQILNVTEKAKLDIKTLIKKLHLSGQENGEDKSKNFSIDNFRTSNVYPTSEEILMPNYATSSKYLVEGKYDNVDHYLHVQFRLFKENFIASLRDEITKSIEFVNNISSPKKLSNFTIYSNGFFQSIVSTPNSVGVIIKFSNQATMEEVFDPRCIYFKYGDLVLFTKDNFSSVFFGHIVYKNCEEQCLIIGIEPEYNDYDLNASYTIIGIRKYFKPYYSNLKTLQCMSEVDFPMKKYLVDVDLSVELPGYLDGSSIYTIEGRKVDLFGNNWPDAEQLQLDSSQYSAFKAVLTQKFNVVQGFPGTGKTYLGLQVVKTLLHKDNKKIWYNGSPILIVSSTNQALDTFLEGLLSTTSEIIRVGFKVKNEKLEKFCLSNAKLENYDYHNVVGTWKHKIKKLSKEIEKLICHMIQIRKRNIIVNFTHFEDIDENIKASWFSRASNADLCAWLFDGRENLNIDQQLIEISDIINDIIEEEKALNFADDKITSDEKLTNSAESQQTVLFSKSYIWIQIERIKKKLQNIKPQDNHVDRVKALETELINLWQTYQYFKVKMSDPALSQPPTKPISVDYYSPRNMDFNDRWNLYFYWFSSYISFVEKRLLDLQYKHRELNNNLDEIGNSFYLEDIKCRSPLVLGITIQAASQWHTTLQALGCRIIVVEEASQILESELLVSLSKHCEHLILLDDHHRLPQVKTEDNIDNLTNTSRSLMERMEINKMQCHVLGVQHRMSSKISQLLVPRVYSQFDSYPSVTTCPSNLGIPSCIFFVHHEPRNIDEYTTSEYYLYEAKFLINLARYMRQAGCEPEDITILVSCYTQMPYLCKESKKYKDLLEGVRICTLGEFKSQESKVILLSLVKNNNDGKIDYQKKEKLIIFAISRAKEFLYMMGNIDFLCQDNETWKKIKEALLERNCLGNYFPLCCQYNPDHITPIEEPDDFDKIPIGVCSEICGTALNCGHQCLKSCYILNCDHNKSTMCIENPKIDCNDCGNCTYRILDCGHEHVLPCYMDSNDFKCPTRVHVTLPCGHDTTEKPCHIDANEWKCDLPCDARIEPCGHSCIRTCHVSYDYDHIEYKCYKTCDRILKDCSTETHKCKKYCCQQCSSCNVIVTKKLDCDHYQAIICSESGYKILCMESCGKKIAKCGHDCNRKCYEPCGGCEEMALKTVPSCGHQVWTKCNEAADVQNCHGSCPKILPCGHPCVKNCNEVCTEDCRELINHPRSSFCGHTFKIECYFQTKPLPNYSNSVPQICEEPCAAILDCSHKCSGTCGECFQGRIHVTCMEKCGITLICGHECKMPCREVCQPCHLKCSMKCAHNKCTKTCGEVCTKCQENCTRRCIHAVCTAKCGDICTVSPCQEPCQKKLPCSHRCVGYCGDPCPPLCRICNAEELTEVFLGYEDEIDARFVLLNDCNHVIESKGMEKYCGLDDGGHRGIKYRRCPRCRTPITSTQRYSDYIKQAIHDVAAMKRNSYGGLVEIEEKRKELQEQLVELKVLQQRGVFAELQSFDKFITDCYSFLEPIHNNKEQRFDLPIGKTFQAKLTIVQNIGNILQTQKLNDNNDSTTSPLLKNKVTSSEASIYVEFLFSRLTQQQVEQITHQEIQDFERELIRLQRIAQFVNLAVSSSSKSYKKLKEIIYKPVIYTVDYDKIVKDRLEKMIKKINCDGKLTST